MKAGWTIHSMGSHSEESRDVTILEYMNADYYVDNDGWLFIDGDDEELAIFPPGEGEWAGVERF